MPMIHHRCHRIDLALAAYSDDEPSNLIDLLTDAMHWCRMNGHDFAALLGTASMHFDHETIQPCNEKGTNS